MLRPRVLLLDEPLGALDAKLRKQLQLELRAVQREVGITFVYVTHDQEEALTMSDQIAVLAEGRVEQVGPPQEIYSAPATTFVAGFLGAANIFDAEVLEAGRRIGGVLGAVTPGSAPRSTTSAVPGAAAIVIRPGAHHAAGSRRANRRRSATSLVARGRRWSISEAARRCMSMSVRQRALVVEVANTRARAR